MIISYYPPMQLQIRGEVEADKDQEKKRAVNVATRSLERDLERLKADHATEIEQMLERHKQELSDNKKKQWVRFVNSDLRGFLSKYLLIALGDLTFYVIRKYDLISIVLFDNSCKHNLLLLNFK